MESSIGSIKTVGAVSDASSYWELIDASDAIDSDIEFELVGFDHGMFGLHRSVSWLFSPSEPASPVSEPIAYPDPYYYYSDSDSDVISGPVYSYGYDCICGCGYDYYDLYCYEQYYRPDHYEDLDDESMPWTASRKVGRSRTRKVEKRVSEKMRNLKKALHSYVKAVKPGPSVRGKHGLGVKHSFRMEACSWSFYL